MAEHLLRLTEQDIAEVLRPRLVVETAAGSITLTERDLRQVLDDPRTQEDLEREANGADWSWLEQYGPGQVNGLRNPDLIDDETRNAIERAHFMRAERPVLTREGYLNLRARKREGYMRLTVENGADIQADFITKSNILKGY